METMVVKNPMTRPDYAFYHEPTIDEMRQRAIQAIHDFLSIQWSTHKKIAHSKRGAVSHKRFIYEANKIHAGLPYADGGKGLFQFYEFYDEQTGRLNFFGTGEEFNENIGGTCACGVCWSLATVCHSIGGKYINFWMTPKYGYYPVGDYKVDYDIEEFRQHHTSLIIAENGIDKMVECYTKIQPADAVCSSDKDHTMMCIDYPHVELDEDGKIDIEKSYVMIADQRGGQGAGFYDKRDGDDLVHYSGRTEFKYTFKMLLNESYIPVTTAEFLGKEPYERAKITVSAPCTTKEELTSASITSNYPMAVIKLILTKSNGHKVMVDRYMVNRIDPHPESGLARCYPMARMADAIAAAEGKKLEVEVTASNGEVITVASIDL